MRTAFPGALFYAARLRAPGFFVMSTCFSTLCIFILSKTLFKKSKTGLFPSSCRYIEIEYSSFH